MPSELYDQLLARLCRLRGQDRLYKWLAALGLFLIIAAALGIILPVFAHFAAPSLGMRWTLSIAGLLGLLLLLAHYVLQQPLSWFLRPNSPSEIDLALRVGNAHPEVKDRFANALQVYHEAQQNSHDSEITRALAGAALNDAYQTIAPADFSQVVDRRTPRRRLLAAGVAIVIALAIWGMAPNFMAQGAAFLLAPDRTPAYLALRFEVTPGDAEIIKGQSMKIVARANQPTADDANIEWRQADGRVVEEAKMTRALAAGGAQFTQNLENIRESFLYRVRLGKETSRWYNVNVVEPPMVRSLRVTVNFPRYTNRPPLELDENLGDILALPGSTVSVRVRPNKPVEEARLLFSNGESKTLVHESTDDFRGEFTVRQQGTYQFALKDQKGLVNPDAIQYRIELETDQAPAVRIAFPGQDVDLDESMRVPLVIEGDDDYGFSKLQIVYEILEGGAPEGKRATMPLTITNKNNRAFREQPVWDLARLDLQPEDVVRYYAEVFDNDVISGPKSGRSQIFHLRFPSIYEMYQEIAGAQEEASQDLQAVYEQAKKAKEQIDQLVQEMKKDPNLNWEQKQKLSESAGATQKMQEQIQQIQQRLEEMVDSMERNDLLSVQTLEKYLELQKLMQEMKSPELQKALEEMQKAMQNLDPEKLEEAMKNLQFSQEEFLKSIERTINLLKQVQAEQKLDEAIKKTEDLLKRQEEVNQEAAKNPSQDKREELAEKETAMKEDAKSLQQSMEDLSKLMQQLPQAPSEKIEAAAQMLNSPDMAGEMQQMASKMQQGQMSQAQQSGQRIASTLQQMQQALQGAQQEMRESHRREVMQALQRSSNDLLQLSKQQEQLLKQSSGMNPNSPQLNQNAERQQELRSGLQRVAEQLYQLAQKSFAVTPEVARAMGQAMNNMQEALNEMEQRNSQAAGERQGAAMRGLDQAVAGLRQSMQQGAGMSMAMSFEQFMQRLLGMSGKQQGINQETQQLGEQGMSAMQQQAAMARLAAEQAAVKKSLEQLMQEFGQRGEILGRLDQTAKDMEDVVKDLQQNRAGRPTIERQQRILSRLLDAQRSMKERDFSKEREAQTGKTYHAIDPGSLPADLGERKSRLYEDLLRALRENYTRDYKDLIQRYFDALAKGQQQSGEKEN
jgi:hypothetical protein